MPVAGARDVGPIRVMHVMYQLRCAGMELGVAKLVNAMDRRRVASSVCSCRPATTARERLAPQIPLFELRRRNGNDPLLIPRLTALLRRERPHIVHTHAWGTLCEGLLAARLAGVPIVVHGEHGTLNMHPRNVVVQRWAWKRVDQMLAVSSDLRSRMAEGMRFPIERILAIRNGVDLSRFDRVDRRGARALLQLPGDALVVGTVGRLVPVKNHALLLEAVARLDRAGIAVVAVFAGDGPLRDELRARVEALGIADSVRFLGERQDVEQVFAAMDVFVLPSVSEGMSNTIQEAMAAGLPVVATRVGGAGELVVDGETGLLVPSQDVGALSGAIGRLAGDQALRRQLGHAARDRAEREFSLTRMVRDYEDLYRDLVERHPALARRASRQQLVGT